MLGFAQDAQRHLEQVVADPLRLGADIDRDLRRAFHAEGARRHRMLKRQILGVLRVQAEARRGIGIEAGRRIGVIGHGRVISLLVRCGCP